MADQNPTTSPEIFKPIPGFPGYEVSDQGTVRSYWRRLKAQGFQFEISPTPQKILCQTLSEGYPSVSLGRGVYMRVHVLILLAFVGPCPQNMEACHKDGSRTKNFLDNLRWGTPSSNQLDRRKHGTDHINVGENHPRAKLTEAEVIQIRTMAAQGAHLQKDIAEMFKIPRPCVSMIVHRKYWKHIP